MHEIKLVHIKRLKSSRLSVNSKELFNYSPIFEESFKTANPFYLIP